MECKTQDRTVHLSKTKQGMHDTETTNGARVTCSLIYYKNQKQQFKVSKKSGEKFLI
jgi:hypothetical protein